VDNFSHKNSRMAKFGQIHCWQPEMRGFTPLDCHLYKSFLKLAKAKKLADPSTLLAGKEYIPLFQVLTPNLSLPALQTINFTSCKDPCRHDDPAHPAKTYKKILLLFFRLPAKVYFFG